MLNNIQKIDALIPNSERRASIVLDGQNLIITGVNGCGKTQFINSLYDQISKKVINRQNPTAEQLSSQIEAYEQMLRPLNEASHEYGPYTQELERLNLQLTVVKKASVTVHNIEQLTIDFHRGKAVLLKFDATRQADIRPSASSRSLTSLMQEAKNHPNSGALFEEYLVSQKTAQAYAESANIDNNPKAAQRIASWFNKLEKDLRELFEDRSLRLSFESSSQSFFIKQKSKQSYRFQQLSSGFSSILSIYADLLTRIQLNSISPDALYGVVFIDEIDAHLHVSLQRKILSFLVKSFPKIQFVVTTHSPFVVASVSDAVIYDLSTLQQVEDLSMYSYESILSGLFNVSPISEILQNRIIELSDLTNASRQDIPAIEALVRQIGEHETSLDSESALFLKKAKIIINKSRSRDA